MHNSLLSVEIKFEVLYHLPYSHVVVYHSSHLQGSKNLKIFQLSSIWDMPYPLYIYNSRGGGEQSSHGFA